jgi:hypothetical protein
MRRMGQELSDPRRAVASQDLGTTLWGMASSDFNNPDVYVAVAARWTPEMAARAKPQELSNSVWALASADVQPKYLDAFDTTILSARQRIRPSHPRDDPVITIFALAAQEVMRRPHDFKAQELKDVLWAFSRLGIRHPILFRFTAEYIIGTDDKPGRSLKEFSIQAVGNTAWSYARQAQLGADTIQRYKGKTTLPRCGGRLAHYVVLYADVGEKLIHELFYNVAEMDLFEFGRFRVWNVELNIRFIETNQFTMPFRRQDESYESSGYFQHGVGFRYCWFAAYTVLGSCRHAAGATTLAIYAARNDKFSLGFGNTGLPPTWPITST